MIQIIFQRFLYYFMELIKILLFVMLAKKNYIIFKNSNLFLSKHFIIITINAIY